MGTNPEIVIYRLTAQGLPANVPIPRNQFSGRVNFIGDVIRTGSKDATLSIRDFTKQDEGDFECSIQGAVSITHKVTIIAMVLSNVTDFRVINVAKNNVVQGTEVTLSCTATVGKPSSNIKLLNGTNVLNSSMTSTTSSMTVFYNFKNIAKKDSGEYICEVKTTNGYVSRKVLQLSVKYPPEIAKSVTTEQFGCLKKSISLGCEASGNPKPKIRITGPNKESLNNEFILQRFGVYICEANNTLGSDKLNITVSLAEDKPGEPVFSQCAFDKLTWLPSISKTSVKYTLQAKEVSGIWFDILTSSDTMYSPSTNETLSNSKDYEFRVVASNCVGNTESKICSVTGQKTPGKRSGDSSNTGVIVGSVIGALVVIIIILILLICWKKRQQRKDPSNVRVKLSPTKNNPSNVKNEGGVVYRDTPDMNTPQVPPPAQYQQDDNDDRYENDYNQKSTNIPSWV